MQHSSGSDSDGVIKRPCLHPPSSHHLKNSKARTKLSPLLENACSPISKDSSGQQHHPSPLTTALSTTPVKTLAVVSTASSHQDHTHHHTHQQALPRLSSATPTVTAPLPYPSSTSLSLPPPHTHPHPAFIGSGGLLAAGMAARNSSLGQQLMSTATPTISLARPFPAVSAFLPQMTQPHAILHQNPQLPHLQGAFPYNPLVSSTAPLRGYGGIIPQTTPYFPFVGLMAPPPPPPTSYLSYAASTPYLHQQHHHAPPPSSDRHHHAPHHHVVAMNNSSYDSSSASLSHSRMVLDDSSRRDNKQLQSVPPWFIFSNNRSEKVGLLKQQTKQF